MHIQENKHVILSGTLTEDHRQFYRDYGFLVADRLLSAKAVEEIRQETRAIFTGERGPVEGLMKDEKKPDTQAPATSYAAIHFPHKVSPLIQSYAAHPQVAAILSAIVSPNVKCMQTMLFMKVPGKKGQSWHQDEYYIPTRDRSLTGAWLALDDATLENGCLWVIPGSHKAGYLKKRIPYTGGEYADVEVCELTQHEERTCMPVEVRAGSIIFFNGYLLHMSLQNKSASRFRRALVSHYSSAESLLPWDLDGRIAPQIDYRDIFMVAGQDPYAYKGYQNLAQPFVRPDKVDFNTDASRQELSAR
jgi:phytanoyl-CoA hydroxylase